MDAQQPAEYDWCEDWKGQTDHAKDAARALYFLGAAGAKRKNRIRYAEASAHLNELGLGYGGVRNLLPLDALAGLCATLAVPDLSSILWSQATIDLKGYSSPNAQIPRWANIGDKEFEESKCYRRKKAWPPPTSA